MSLSACAHEFNSNVEKGNTLVTDGSFTGRSDFFTGNLQPKSIIFAIARARAIIIAIAEAGGIMTAVTIFAINIHCWCNKLQSLCCTALFPQ
jgi:hypothetical protein